MKIILLLFLCFISFQAGRKLGDIFWDKIIDKK